MKFDRAEAAAVGGSPPPEWLRDAVRELLQRAPGYAALDSALSRVFHDAPRRNIFEQTIRGIVVTGLFVALPMVAFVTGSVASWLIDLAPDELGISGAARGLWQAASPLSSFALSLSASA